jgi:hypothetical protein
VFGGIGLDPTRLTVSRSSDNRLSLSLFIAKITSRARMGVYFPAFAAARRKAVSTNIGGTGTQRPARRVT